MKSQASLLHSKLTRDIAELKAPEGFLRAGWPRYFTLFGRDSLIAAWQMLPLDPAIAQNTLLVLAALQGKTVDSNREEEPGKILHEWWGDLATRTPQPKTDIPWPFPYYGSIDATFLFIIVADRYFQTTRDQATLTALRPALVQALTWIKSHADPDHDALVEYERRNPQGITQQGWRDAPRHPAVAWQPPITLVEVQGYKYAALTSIKNLLRSNLETSEIRWIEHEQTKLKKAFLKLFMWDQEEYFYFLLDRDNNPTAVVTSNPGHLLFTDLLPKTACAAVVRRLFAPDMWTPYGIRTESTQSPLFIAEEYQQGAIWPHDNWIIAQGLHHCGYHQEYERIKKALIKAHQHFGHIPELYVVTPDHTLHPQERANSLQAWASGALLNMLVS
jgi:glycogen debranching enzyme